MKMSHAINEIQSEVFYLQQLGDKFKAKNSMKENISNGRHKQLRHHLVLFNYLCVVRG